MRKTGEQLLIMDWQMDETGRLGVVIWENLGAVGL